MEQKKISVCMATYNGELYIEDQLKSILNQLSKNDEVIISDDGSMDNTLNIIKSFNDPRIVLYHSSYKNVILNFENAIKKANGELIFLADQDDIWYDNKVTESVKVLENYDLVFTNLNVFSNTIDESYLMYDVERDYNGFTRNLIKNHCVGATMAFKATLLKYILPFPKHIEMHDMWIYFISSFYGKTYYYNQPLIYYRRHGQNVSNTGGKTTNNVFKIFKIRMVWVISIFKRMIKTSNG